MISGDLGLAEKEKFQESREEIGDIGRMLNVLLKSLENKRLDPGNLETWNSFSQLIGRKTL